jgi:hypothetical protein
MIFSARPCWPVIRRKIPTNRGDRGRRDHRTHVADYLQQPRTISLETFKRLMDQMALGVAPHVSAPEALRTIEQDWGEIRVGV